MKEFLHQTPVPLHFKGWKGLRELNKMILNAY